MIVELLKELNEPTLVFIASPPFFPEASKASPQIPQNFLTNATNDLRVVKSDGEVLVLTSHAILVADYMTDHSLLNTTFFKICFY